MTPPPTTPMSREDRRRVVPARLDAFDELGGFLEALAGAAGLPRAAGLRLRLVVEELFTNTIVHGHGGDSEAPVTVTADVRAGRIDLVYEDTAPPFDPFAPRPRAAGAHAGGHGLALVAGLTDAATYTRAGHRNRIALAVSGVRR